MFTDYGPYLSTQDCCKILMVAKIHFIPFSKKENFPVPEDVYGVDASAEMISHMTDRILPIAKEWQNRPLERKYAVVFMDAIQYFYTKINIHQPVVFLFRA